MNYIKHLNKWLDLVSLDDRLSSSHISIYMALFHSWNKNRFPNKLFIYRNEIMQISKVGSTRTYYKCMHQLHGYGYIVYTPSKCPMKGSTVSIVSLEDISLDVVLHNEENSDENEGENAPSSPCSTQVALRQNRPITCSQNAPSDASRVTPLFINNINLINYKQRERRARTREDLIFSKKLKDDVASLGSSSAELSSSECTPISKPVSGARAEYRLESKKIVPRVFSPPTLDQIREFFQFQLSGKHLVGVLNEENRLFEAEKFFHHYESNGWLLAGKVPMRSWKSACRSWTAKIPYFSRKAGFAPAERKNFHVEIDEHYGEPL